jgi:hypothetical protein
VVSSNPGPATIGKGSYWPLSFLLSHRTKMRPSFKSPSELNNPSQISKEVWFKAWFSIGKCQ